MYFGMACSSHRIVEKGLKGESYSPAHWKSLVSPRCRSDWGVPSVSSSRDSGRETASDSGSASALWRNRSPYSCWESCSRFHTRLGSYGVGEGSAFCRRCLA